MRPPQWSIQRCISNAKTCCSSVCIQTLLPGGRGTCSQRPLSGKLSLKICRAASTNYLSATSLGPLTFFGSTSPLASFHLLSGTYTPRLCAPICLPRTNRKGRGPKTPTLAVALGMGLALQFAESRKRGPAASCWASVRCKSFIYLRPQLPVSADGRWASEQHGSPQPPDQSACHLALSTRMTG